MGGLWLGLPGSLPPRPGRGVWCRLLRPITFRMHLAWIGLVWRATAPLQDTFPACIPSLFGWLPELSTPSSPSAPFPVGREEGPRARLRDKRWGESKAIQAMKDIRYSPRGITVYIPPHNTDDHPLTHTHTNTNLHIHEYLIPHT